jgi:osmotically-inducible protein OsmY
MTSNRQIERNERDLQADAVQRLGRTDQRPLQDNPEAGRFTERRSWVERTKDEVSSWFGNTAAMRRRQWDEAAGDHGGEGPTRFVDTDTRIVEVLENRLTVDRELDASNIQVACSEGVVTLDGSVTTTIGAQRAENLAVAVHGVTRVVNNLIVA